MATWTPETAVSTIWTDESSAGRCVIVFLLIDDTNFFLIDDTYRLIIDKYGTCWDNEQETN